MTWLNTLRQRQNGRHFADDTFNRIFVYENVKISIKFSLKFVHKGPINNIPALVQIMAWRRPGDKPLSEPVMVSLLTHMCVIRPQWVNSSRLHGVHIMHVYASINMTIIGSNNGSSPDRRQAIIWTKAIANWTIRNKLQWKLYQNSTIYIQENVFSAANLAIAGFPLTNALGENLPSRY